jgi:Flp pilus assembly pilin Flp
MFFDTKLAIEAIQATLNKLFGIKSQKGVNLIEYAFLGVLMATALVGSIQSIRDKTAELLASTISAFP